MVESPRPTGPQAERSGAPWRISVAFIHRAVQDSNVHEVADVLDQGTKKV